MKISKKNSWNFKQTKTLFSHRGYYFLSQKESTVTEDFSNLKNGKHHRKDFVKIYKFASVKEATNFFETFEGKFVKTITSNEVRILTKQSFDEYNFDGYFDDFTDHSTRHDGMCDLSDVFNRDTPYGGY